MGHHPLRPLFLADARPRILVASAPVHYGSTMHALLVCLYSYHSRTLALPRTPLAVARESASGRALCSGLDQKVPTS
ncbi:hypothetical protein OH77DRAFT_204865 [Trametes cingulata]|nr:hypothetical protein OH77DRAFT_204865 [Trametes cingulata]